jgi:hypothetical protein
MSVASLIQRLNLIVHGVGHSGTTILTRMLFALDWTTGGDAGAVDDEYAEHIRIREANRHAFQHGALPADTLDLVRELRGPWAVKDPHFVMTLPLWESAFSLASAGLPVLLWITRSLEEVKESYRRREIVPGQPGSHGHTVDELHELARRHYEAWRGPKVHFTYESIAVATALFLSPDQRASAQPEATC